MKKEAFPHLPVCKCSSVWAGLLHPVICIRGSTDYFRVVFRWWQVTAGAVELDYSFGETTVNKIARPYLCTDIYQILKKTFHDKKDAGCFHLASFFMCCLLFVHFFGDLPDQEVALFQYLVIPEKDITNECVVRHIVAQLSAGF